MMSPPFARFSVFSRRMALMLLASSVGGCVAPLFSRFQSPDEPEPTYEYEEKTVFVGDLTAPFGINALKVESVALVTELEGTGSNPPPGPVLERLQAEMLTHKVDNHAQLLALPSTSLVLVRGYIPPGAQKGDRFDVEVYLPGRSETTSLRGGWLLKSRLREIRVMGASVHTGNVAALAAGPVLVDALFESSDDKIRELKGRVLGGGEVLTPRTLGLVVRDEHSSILTSSKIGSAINARFHSTFQGKRKGAANPTTDNYIELQVHPTYKQNLTRYLQVVRKIVVDETAAERTERLMALERRLLDPASAARAALELEAIGSDGVRVLQKGLAINDPEVRFYSAEALAYLDSADAAEPLRDAARLRAFRWRALTALATMDHVAAYDALTELLGDSSAETRYGAFYALRVRNPGDPLVRGELLAGEFSYHVVPTAGEPMVHFSRTKRPEIILFNQDQTIRPPQFLYAGKHIMGKGLDDGRIRLTRFTPGQEDQVKICAPQLDQVVRAIVDLGGSYGEVMDAVRQLQSQGDLPTRVVIDATPKPGRVYHRDTPETDESTAENDAIRGPAGPAPELFFNPLGQESPRQNADDEEVYPLDEPQQKKGFFGRLTGWLPD